MEKCALCDRQQITISIHEFSDRDEIRTTVYCGPIHALLDMLKRYGRLIKASSSTSTVKGYLAATAAIEKLSKSLGREVG